MARARHAGAIQSKLMTIIFGEPFTGKSTLASQLAYFKRSDGEPFRVLYIDAESGSIDDYIENMKANGVDLKNIYIVYTQSTGEVKQYISKIKNNEDFYELDDDGNETEEVVLDASGKPFRADALVIDGSTILNLSLKQGLVEFSKKRNAVKAKKDGLIGDEKLVKVEGAGLELKDYNTINFKGQDLILDLMASGVHCVVTARETDEKVSVKDSDGKITSISTGKKIPDGFKSMTYNAKTVIRTFRDEDGNVCAEVQKDRTGVHADNDVIIDPTFLDWQSVIDKTAKNKEYVIKNDLTKSVEVEQDIYKREILGAVGEPVEANETTETTQDSFDDIKAKITAIQKSLSPVEKTKAKAALTEKNLPIAIKSVTDTETLNKIYEILSAFKK